MTINSFYVSHLYLSSVSNHDEILTPVSCVRGITRGDEVRLFDGPGSSSARRECEVRASTSSATTRVFTVRALLFPIFLFFACRSLRATVHYADPSKRRDLQEYGRLIRVRASHESPTLSSSGSFARSPAATNCSDSREFAFTLCTAVGRCITAYPGTAPGYHDAFSLTVLETIQAPDLSSDIPPCATRFFPWTHR